MDNKTFYINGVNQATLKKIAKFVFGESNCLAFRIAGKQTFVIYLKKEYYYQKESLIKKYIECWQVEVKPID